MPIGDELIRRSELLNRILNLTRQTEQTAGNLGQA